MNNQLFEEFNKVSSKEWKNKIQYELKGADYNDTLVWESLEGIKVKPFYHNDVDNNPISIDTQTSSFKIVQSIYVFDLEKSIKKAKNTLQKGAEVIYFTIDNTSILISQLFEKLPKENTYFIQLTFLDVAYIEQASKWLETNLFNAHILIDPIHQLTNNGNWFANLEQDIKNVNQLTKNSKAVNICINTQTYQNAGANITQQIAYTLAHLNEYFNRVDTIHQTIFIQVAVGTNYFFEIAKIKALRLLIETLKKEYTHNFDIKIIATPTKRNKTLYDYNVNMLRTTTECMSAILGGADFVLNLPYDAIYHKDNEFSDRIARNQLLILKEESYFNIVDNPTEGTYYIDQLTIQLAEKALDLFKQIEKADGLITSLIEGTIQRKINESATKEQELFNAGKEVLLGTNKYPNPQDFMSNDLELYPFVKQNPRKTLIAPIIERRLAEAYEQQRLEQEKNKTN